ncbi:MAG TPA: alpha/beta hydrolase [Methanocellaceae archaeon]|jgi:proline iminopeptidase
MSVLANGEHDVLLNGLRLHYSVKGQGPAMIAIYGGPGMDARGLDDFAGIYDFVTVVAMHPRGSGLSGPAPGGAYLLQDYAADVEALRLHLGLEKPIVFGWSHGGMVAQYFAFTYPDSLSKLILLDTSACCGEFLGDMEAAVREFKDRPWFSRSYEALQKEWAGDYRTDEDMAELWAEEIKFYFKDFDERAEAYRRRTKDLPMRIAPLKCFNEREAPTMDLRGMLDKIKVPVLIIVGRHDFITPVSMSEGLVRHIRDARLDVFEESGHYAFVEEPEKFNRIVRGFLGGDH